MSLIIDKQVNNHSRMGIWEIQESYEELFSMLNLNQAEIKTVQNFKNHRRKLEWMSVRVLLNKLTDKHNTIVYNGNRKPFLADKSHNISISHSYQYAAVLISEKRHAGIDIEIMQPKIKHIAKKFINNTEHKNIIKSREIYHLYLHWCAKEALYKMFDKKDISFKNNITIEPFKPSDEGKITGEVITGEINEKVDLNYFHINNYSIVWGFKD
jgi:4'-phosphopantetheinyl transferase EntD